ncbi:MAG: DUF721 domain-containing protein [Acidobacteriia bacterium]|nr:DUF721 domain-containing protein [Methyloceanibacter sp.]MBX5471460.1 DUF721 domain-containing protein [Acetobacteraceae bacterium]MCL6490289.1 DUF721 domain-containing protein [Terriglobia bacterium]
MDTKADMPAKRSPGKSTESQAERHIYGPRMIASVLAGVTRPAFRKRGPATARLLAEWPNIVGPELAQLTTPKRLAAGTLTIACAGPAALELQHLSTELLQRIALYLGPETVKQLRFVQNAGLPPRKTPSLPKLAPARDDAAPAGLADFPPGLLRDSLLSLARCIRTASQ